jgi:hypothetical protein
LCTRWVNRISGQRITKTPCNNPFLKLVEFHRIINRYKEMDYKKP